MSLVRSVIQFPRKVRIADIIVVAALVGLVYWLATISREWGAKSQAVVQIHTEFKYLPLYTVYSLTRGLVAYLISLGFTIAYGYVMAHSRRAEQIMLPLLDILQSIPVLSFLPAFSIALIGLFPNTNVGLELVCVLAIFVGQVWNMTYAFYRALRGIPTDMRDAAESFYLSKREILRKLELPASAIPLIWNSMMSMAGGWFFLTVCEAFTLGDRDFRLPGVGSYMSVAIEKGNVPAMIAAVIAMGIMIILLDRVLWRPLVIWSRKFRMEDTAEEFDDHSFVLDILQGSKLVTWISEKLKVKEEKRKPKMDRPEIQLIKNSAAKLIETFQVKEPKARKAIGRIMVIGLVLTFAYGLFRSLHTIVTALTPGEWGEVGLGMSATLGRTIAAVVLSALWTIPVGAIIGQNHKLSRRLQPVIQFMASFPAPMIFPIILIGLARFHVSIEIGSILMMIIGTQWYMLFNVISGASSIPNDLQEMTDVFGLPRIQRWKKLVLPALFPSIIIGMTTAAGGAWNTSIVAENYVVPGKERMMATGIGAMISLASEKENTAMLIASTAALALTVVMINKFLWRRLFNFASERYTLNK
jgi:NitT/TauT family transport system permease protein